MFKIQVRVNNVKVSIPAAPESLLKWQDMQKMPPFAKREDAEEWIVSKSVRKLEQFGLEFQIVEIEYM